MRKIAWIPVAVVAPLAIAMSACSPHSGAKPHATYTAPAAKASVEAKVEKCAQGANFVTKSGRLAYAKCVSPSNPQAVQSCVEKNIVGVNVLTPAGRQDFINKVSVCV